MNLDGLSCQELATLKGVIEDQITSAQTTYQSEGCPGSGAPMCGALEELIQILQDQLTAINDRMAVMHCAGMG